MKRFFAPSLIVLLALAIPGWGWLLHLIWWAVLIVGGTTLTTTTAFFVNRRLKERFPESPGG